MQTEQNTAYKGGLARLEFLENEVAVLYLGAADEKVITLTVERINSIKEAIARLKQQKPPGLIICSPHADMFTAGADINLIQEVTQASVGEKLASEGQTLFD